jgi:DNA-binding NarL/FixJ family response regulator
MAARILIVDDDPLHLACTRDLLLAEGYEVDAHLTAFGATEKLIRTRPDLVLIDVNMPALSGEGLVSILRKRVHAAGVRVLLYSSNDEDSLRQAVSRLAIDGYVCKGDPEELRRKVGRALAAGRGR